MINYIIIWWLLLEFNAPKWLLVLLVLKGFIALREFFSIIVPAIKATNEELVKAKGVNNDH